MSRPFRELADATGTPESRRIANERTLDLLADEIERLQNELYAKSDGKRDVADTARATLTEAEREAIEWCLSLPMLDRDAVRMMPLRSLLERLK